MDEDKDGDDFNTLNRLRGFGGAGVIQQEPQDMYGAELHYLAATAQQCLGALAESAVANGDTASASEIAQIFVEAINQPEDGWMFEARQGCAARECAGVSRGEGDYSARSTPGIIISFFVFSYFFFVTATSLDPFWNTSLLSSSFKSKAFTHCD